MIDEEENEVERIARTITLNSLLNRAYTAERKAEELRDALKNCVASLDLAFDFDGDVFGSLHNDATEALYNAKKILGMEY
jgi:GGDEF domain-containing protein